MAGANFPSYADYMAGAALPDPNQPIASVGPQGNTNGNWLSSGVSSGFRQALSEAGSGVQGVATAVGAPGLAQSAKDYAARQQALATQNANPELENGSWLNPRVAGYKIAQGLPMFAGAAGAGLLAGMAAPEEAAGAAVGTGLAGLRGFLASRGGYQALGAAGAMLPGSIGGNVQRAEQDNNGAPLSQGQAVASVGLGVPEAAVQAILPAWMERGENPVNQMLTKYAGQRLGGAIQGAATGAAIQGGAGATTEAITQLVGDPNRSFADRAHGIVQAALSGAFQGAAFGGVFGGLRGDTSKIAAKPAEQMTTEDLTAATDQLVDPDHRSAGGAPPSPANRVDVPRAPPDQLNYPGARDPNRPGAINVADAQQIPEGSMQARGLVPAGSRPANYGPDVGPQTIDQRAAWNTRNNPAPKSTDVEPAYYQGLGYTPDAEAPPVMPGAEPEYGQPGYPELLRSKLENQPIATLMDFWQKAQDQKEQGYKLTPHEQLAHDILAREIYQRFSDQGGDSAPWSTKTNAPEPEQGGLDLSGQAAAGPGNGALTRYRAPREEIPVHDGSVILLPDPRGPAVPFPGIKPSAGDRPALPGDVPRPYDSWSPAQLVQRAKTMQSLVANSGSEATRTRAQGMLSELAYEMAYRARTGQTDPRLLTGPAETAPPAPPTETPPPGSAPYDWAARRKEIQAQTKVGLPAAVKGKSFDSEEALQDHIGAVASDYDARGVDIPPALTKWAKELGVMTPEGQLTGKWSSKPEAAPLVAAPRGLETPSAVSEVSTPPSPSATLSEPPKPEITPEHAAALARAKELESQLGQVSTAPTEGPVAQAEPVQDTSFFSDPKVAAMRDETPPKPVEVSPTAHEFARQTRLAQQDFAEAAKPEVQVRPKFKNQAEAEQFRKAQINKPQEPPAVLKDPISRAIDTAKGTLAKINDLAANSKMSNRFKSLLRDQAGLGRIVDAAAHGDDPQTAVRGIDLVAHFDSQLYNYINNGRAPKEIINALMDHHEAEQEVLDAMRRKYSYPNADRELFSVQRRAQVPYGKDAPPREAVKEIHQPRYDALEKLRLQAHGLDRGPVADDIFKRIDYNQLRLTKPERGETQQIAAETRKLGADINRALEQQLETSAPSVPSDLSTNIPLERGRYTEANSSVAHIIDSTNKGGAVLQYYQQHGSTLMVRNLAKLLGRFNIDPVIRLAKRGDLQFDTKHSNDPENQVFGSYNPRLNRINIYDGRYMEQTVLHEMIHAATAKAIEGGGRHAQALKALFQRLSSRMDAAGIDGKPYGFENEHEFLAESFTNPTFEKFLRRTKVSTGSTVGDYWQALKNLVFGALDMPQHQRSLYDQVMDLGNKVMRENNAEAPATNMELAQKKVSLAADETRSKLPEFLQTMADKYSPLGAMEGVRKMALSWADGFNINQAFKRVVPALDKYTGLLRDQSTRDDALARPGVAADRFADELPQDLKDRLNRVMAGTAQGLDTDKVWGAHTDLLGSKNEAVLHQEHKSLVEDMNELKKSKVGRQAYDMLRAKHQGEFNQALLLGFHQLSDGFYGGIPGIGDDFREFTSADHADKWDDPIKSSAFFRDRLQNAIDRTTSFRDQLSTAKSELEEQIKSGTFPEETLAGMSSRVKQFKSDREYVQELLDKTNEKMIDNNKAPYFHLGRSGTHFVLGQLHQNLDGTFHEGKLNQFGDRLERERFGDTVLMKGTENPSIYIRVRNAGEMARLAQVFKDAARAGEIKDDISYGNATDPNSTIFNGVTPAYMRRTLEQMRANQTPAPEGIDPKKWNDAQMAELRNARHILLNLLPETSMSRIMTKRANVQGFSQDMIGSSKQASAIMSKSISRLSLAAETGRAAVEMADQVRANNHNPDMTANEKLGGSQAVAEMMLREKSKQTFSPSTPLDGLRHLTHMLHIGSSPAYFLTLTSQLLTNSLPELAKTHGYSASAQAIFNATSDTFKILKAITRSPDWMSAGITQGALLKAGVSPAITKFIMKGVANGDYNAGYSREMMAGSEEGMFGHGDGKKFKDAMNMIGVYAELMPRLLTGLASRELYAKAPGKAIVKGQAFATDHEFASHTIKESQGDWTGSLNSRQTARGGIFGAMSPMINQFMGWQTRMTGKLYREVHDAIGGDRQSATWLAGHAGAVAMLAGTLGLPMLSTAASVYDRLADWALDKDSVDVTAAYRTFLANTFGKDMGEIIARGAPRALGMDFDHWGEGSIMPGSAMINALTEKRKLEDAEKDWLKSMGGSTLGELMTLAGGVRDIMNGDYMDGLIKMVPEFLKTPMEGYRLADRNFVDKKGSRLPISAGAWDVAMTVLGIDPAKEAEYSEVKREQTGLKTMAQLDEQNITRHMIMAENRHDPEMLRRWMAESQRYGQEHVGDMPPAADLSRAFAQSLQAAMIARGMGTPVGVAPHDRTMRGLVSYGNFRNGEQ